MTEAVETLRSSYDDLADTLYISIGPKARTRCREDSYGIVWRVNESGDTVGATVQACHRWSKNAYELVDLLVHGLPLTEAKVRKIVETATH